MGNVEGKFISLNFIIDHDTLDFTGYEFEGEEIYMEEWGLHASLFRVDVNKATKDISVRVAYSEDFDVMEDVSDYFNIDKLVDEIMVFVENNKVENYGEDFVKYCKLLNEGYSCMEAMSELY